TGLTAATTYHYRVKSQDAVGGLVTSGDYTLTTSGAPGCKATTCASVPNACGNIPDGCGATLDCGSCPPTNSGTIYYADSNLTSNCAGNYSIRNRACNGSDGSASNTLSGGAALLSGGDTLLIRGGTYNDDLFGAIPSGSSWSTATTVSSYNGESVTLKAS